MESVHNNICNGTSVLNDSIIPALSGLSQETNSVWAAHAVVHYEKSWE